MTTVISRVFRWGNIKKLWAVMILEGQFWLDPSFSAKRGHLTWRPFILLIIYPRSFKWESLWIIIVCRYFFQGVRLALWPILYHHVRSLHLKTVLSPSISEEWHNKRFHGKSICCKSFLPTPFKDCVGIVFTHGVLLGVCISGKHSCQGVSQKP